MNRLIFGIFLSLFAVIYGAYNPIPVGSVIISTISAIFVMQPTEYGGTDKLNVIFNATPGMTIVSSIYDSSARNLYLLYTNTTNSTNSTLYLSQLAALETLASTSSQLPITFDTTDINNLTSFSADVINRRVFLTDTTGGVSLFAMSGLLKTTISPPATLSAPLRSVAYSTFLNRLFVITDTLVDSCVNLDANNLQCCQASSRGEQLRAIAFDQLGGDLNVYVLDKTTGIYQVVLNPNGCPAALRPLNKLGLYTNLQFVIDRGLYFASGSASNGQDNSYLFIANGTNDPRSIPIGTSIVALHISVPNTQPVVSIEESCFHGVTFSSYRAAVILAAIFGTIMGIFMCFNALFCIDFFMTKRIIRNLKQQIPHNLLEDRWNKLVEEKYAKIALEKQRKQDDPPPRRKSSISGRKSSSAANAGNNDNKQGSGSSGITLQVPNPIPKISNYIRRKSESYINRSRSVDYRTQRNRPDQEFTEIRTNPARNQMTTTQAQFLPVEEENESRHGLRQNLSRRELLRDDEEFL